ncbi:hypothetical protein KY290_001542 [Solanum tuberosum]|uniref:Cullin family profile domain-containing protein n=1 Tax=Solanum tuberosum TaxID=4113 RepID=A0ABQ7WMK7_SOLTU|nr:hypothetical protein KY290_001542 [Solanum tuberosum]
MLIIDLTCSANERSILTKLKQQCGGQFTSKMEGMVTYLTLARENQGNFEEYLSNNPIANPGIDLTVTVLTTGFWPSYKSFDLNLPAEMVKCVEVFKELYQTKTKHMKLTWIYSLGTCNINGNFKPKTIELVVTTYQIPLPPVDEKKTVIEDVDKERRYATDASSSWGGGLGGSNSPITLFGKFLRSPVTSQIDPVTDFVSGSY